MNDLREHKGPGGKILYQCITEARGVLPLQALTTSGTAALTQRPRRFHIGFAVSIGSLPARARKSHPSCLQVPRHVDDIDALVALHPLALA